MSLQELLRLGNPSHSLSHGTASEPQLAPQADGPGAFSANARGLSGGGQEVQQPDLSAIVAKAANFIEKQKVARLRRQGDRKGSPARGQRDRGTERTERSRSRRRSKSLLRRRRDRSGSKAKMGRARPKSAGAPRAVKSRPGLSRPRSHGRKRPGLSLPEKSLEEVPLLFAGRVGPIARESGMASSWITIIEDHERRSFVSYRSGAFSREMLRDWFSKLHSELRWDRPEVNGRPLPRSACWLTADGCSCTYHYSGTSWPNMIMPPWFLDITDAVCRACGVNERPNSCNANLYEDETDSVGWHADDEPCFDAKHSDALIISLSLGSTRTFVLRPLDDPKSQTQLSLENGDLATMEGLVQKHYLHAVLSERVARGARINLTWRWVKRHDRECVRRRDRASTVPIKLNRQVSEKKAEFRAAARSAAAVVKNNALQMAAASAESAKLSRAASAGGAPASRAPVNRAPVSRAPVRRAPVSKTGSIFRRPRGSKDVRAASPVREPEEKDRERSSDRNPATVTKAHDAFKRRSDGVRNALDISHSLSDSLSEKIYEKARKLDLGVPDVPLSGDAAGSSLSLADRPKSGGSVSTFLDSHARPAPRGSSKPRRAEATMAMAQGREESTRDAGAALSPSALNKLVLKPRDSKRPDAVARAEGAEGQPQNRSRKGAPSKEELRRRDTPGGRDVPVDTEILLAQAEMLMRPLPSQEGARAEPDRQRPDRSEGTARVWKARSSTGPPSAKDDLPEPVHLRGRDSDDSQMSGQQDRARSHRHVVLKSRSRSPKDRGRAAAPPIRRREDLHEDLQARRPVVLESRRSDFPEPSSSTRQVITSQDEDDRRGAWEGRDGTSPRAARMRTENGLTKSSAGHRTDAQSDRQAPRHRDRPEDFMSTGDWSNRHVEKDPYPNGRSTRRHEDGPTGFRENTYPAYPEERRAPRNALAEHTSDRKGWQRRDGESQSHQPHGRPEEEHGSRSHAATSERLAPRDDERRYKDRPREEERRTPRTKTSEALPPPPPPPRDDRHDQEERSYRTGQPHLSSNRWSEAASSTEEFRDRGDRAPNGQWLTSRDGREQGERHRRDGAHDYRREWDPDPREKETWDHRPSRRESHRFDDFSGPREIHEERQEQRVWRGQRSAKHWDPGRRPKDGMHTESARQERQAFDARSSNRSTQWRETTPRTRR